MPLHPFLGGRNGFGLSLLLGGEHGKETLTVPPSGSPDSYDPKMLWRIVANGGERGGVMVANYVTAFVPHSVSHGSYSHGDVIFPALLDFWPFFSNCLRR